MSARQPSPSHADFDRLGITPVDLIRRDHRPFEGTPGTSCVICSMPRSGSWLLACALEETGVAGHPSEYFTPPTEAMCARRWAVDARDLPAYRAALWRAATTPNGVLSLKIQWLDLVRLLGRARAAFDGARSAGELLAELFPNPRFVLLTRRDMVAQVISWWRAHDTGVWWQLEDPPEPEPRAVRTEPRDPDLAEIATIHAAFVEHEKGWRAFFEKNAIRPQEIVYEELVGDYEATVRRVLDHCCLAHGEDLRIPPQKSRRQSDERTQRLVDAYRRHVAGRS